MVLNYIWVAFFITAFAVGLIKLIFFGDTEVFRKIVVDGTFISSKKGFEVALGLTGAMTLWSGLMKVGEQAGAINFLSRIIGPFFRRLFPQIPKNHPALGQIILNFSANMLGLGNAFCNIEYFSSNFRNVVDSFVGMQLCRNPLH